jgi:hypothetical protein
MKIQTWANIDPIEVEVEVTLEHIRASLQESPQSRAEAFQLINRCAVVIKSIDPEIIREMSSEVRKIIADFFTEQAAKYTEDKQ